MIPKTIEQLVEEHRLFQLKAEAQAAAGPGRGRYVPSVGQAGARVAVVGFCPPPKETQAFSGIIGEMLDSCSVPPQWLLKTYLVRRRPASVKALAKAILIWTPLLMEELAIVRPNAVILLGQFTARAVLGTNEFETEKLRKTRFVLKNSIPETNFFVTFSPEEVCGNGGLDGNKGQYWHFDYMAVFEGITKYFNTTRIIEA